MNLSNDFEFNILVIDNYINSKSKFRKIFKLIIENHNKILADVVEFGVFEGRFLLSKYSNLKLIKLSANKYDFERFALQSIK